MTETKSTSVQKSETQVVKTDAGDVHITQPATRKGHKPKITILLDSDDLVRGQFGGFANFLKDYAVVGLAVGFIVGQQAGAVMKQLVATFVDPITIVWFGQNLSSRVAIVHHGTKPVSIPWGAFVYTLIDFFVILFTVYVIIKLFRLDKFKKQDAVKK